MNMKASQSKRQEEGCGKWLTTKGKLKKVMGKKARHHQQNPKPHDTIRALRPICFTPNGCENQSRKMKQCTMSQFLEEKSSKLKVKEDKRNSNEETTSSSKDKVPVVLFLKNEIPSAPIEYVLEDLFGSDADESDIFQIEDKIQKTTVDKKQNTFELLPAVHCKNAQIASSSKRAKVNTNEEKGPDKLHSPPKKHTNSNNIARNINSTRKDDVQFTEWLEVDALVQQSDEEKNLLNQENLSMSCGCTFSCKPRHHEDKTTSLAPQFSEWFDEQIIKMDDKLPAVNILQSPVRNGSQNKSTFTQWFEANMENIKSPC